MHSADRRSHWDDRYHTIGHEAVSWYEAEPRLSLDLIELVGAGPDSSVIDLGGGASSLARALEDRGFSDLTVLDISSEALDAAKAGLRRPSEVTWICADLLDWSPARRWAVLHDRAVFHFLTDPDDRAVYRDLLRSGVEPNGSVVIATFAEDGPTSCSGLPVERYRPDRLLTEIGPAFTEIGHGRVDHVSLTGVIQPFTWVAARNSTTGH
jgi:2-polyprenyl-3-methyl-5-hydroxy-6-metoxy-1,4-benzoquinol methylase